MKILVIAYEYYPRQSPQALRWRYLAREFVVAGDDVHILTSKCLFSSENFAAKKLGDPTVHRTSPGWLSELKHWLSRRNRATLDTQLSGVLAAADDGARLAGAKRARAALNWKGRMVASALAAWSSSYFPDERGEWARPARKRLTKLLEQLKPDVVISSHEPATALELGVFAHHQGYRWVADLGDPVLAPYTPSRWARRSRELEALTCEIADAVVVTSLATRELLVQRNKVSASRFHLITQGYPSVAEVGRSPVGFDENRLELLFSGAFYDFRDPAPLLQAILRDDGVRLTIVSANFPDRLQSVVDRCADRVRLLGFVNHTDVLEMQRQADVLVNIANEGSVQVPGKVYEYLGARKPILHIGNNFQDGVPEMLSELGAGIACAANADSILLAFARLRGADTQNTSQSVQASSRDAYSWSALAERYRKTLASVCQRARS